MRHVDIRQHWIRQETKAGRLDVEWVATSKQQADELTKLLARGPFEKFVKDMGLSEAPVKK